MKLHTVVIILVKIINTNHCNREHLGELPEFLNNMCITLIKII